MVIDIVVQYPNKPSSEVRIGQISDSASVEEVIAFTGIPREDVMDIKIIGRRKGTPRWSLVTWWRPRVYSDFSTCPHCGGKL